MIKSVNDVLYRNYRFKVSLSIFGDDGPEKKDDKFKSRKLVTISKPANNLDGNSLYFDTFSRGIIGLYALDKENKVSEQFHISQRSYHELLEAMRICNEWLTSKKYKHLFNTDPETGIVKSLGHPAPYNPSVFKNQNEYIRFYPAVVKDYDGLSYEGVAIRTQKGYLTQLTNMDFMVFYKSLKTYLDNSYASNLNLLTLGVLLNQLKNKPNV